MTITKKMFLVIYIFLNFQAQIFADGNQIIGSGSFSVLPGRNISERHVMNQDIARARPGDYFWRVINDGNNGVVKYVESGTGKKWGWLYVVQGDITWAKQHNFMAGFAPKLPDVDESGEKYMEYQKNADYSRKLFDRGTIEDVITKNVEFDKTLSEFKKSYPNPIPRKNDKIEGAKNWYYLDKVPADFPNTFWASITLEGRIMKVVIANGPAHRISVSYWAQDSFMREFPNASWSWSGDDKAAARDAKKIQEDISETSAYLEF
jgi:hypothetical protein